MLQGWIPHSLSHVSKIKKRGRGKDGKRKSSKEEERKNAKKGEKQELRNVV